MSPWCVGGYEADTAGIPLPDSDIVVSDLVGHLSPSCRRCAVKRAAYPSLKGQERGTQRMRCWSALKHVMATPYHPGWPCMASLTWIPPRRWRAMCLCRGNKPKILLEEHTYGRCTDRLEAWWPYSGRSSARRSGPRRQRQASRTVAKRCLEGLKVGDRVKVDMVGKEVQPSIGTPVGT
jgi:hypothetical protein